MTTSRLTTIARLRQLYKRIELDTSFEVLQVAALHIAIEALEDNVTVFPSGCRADHHWLIDVEFTEEEDAE